MIFEPALLKSAGSSQSKTSSTFQHVVYFQGWEGYNTALTLKTSQIVESRINFIASAFQKHLFKNH